MTFSDVYEKWSFEYFKGLKNPSSARTYIAAYKHSEPLYDIRIIHM